MDVMKTDLGAVLGAASTLGTNLRTLLSIRKDIFPGSQQASQQAPRGQGATTANYQGYPQGRPQDSILQLLVKQESCEDEYLYPALPPPPPPPPPPGKGAGRARYSRDPAASSKRCPKASKTPSPPPICILAAAGTGVANFGPLGRAQQPPGPGGPAPGGGGGGGGGGVCGQVGGTLAGSLAGPLGGPSAGACCGPLSVVASHNIGRAPGSGLPSAPSSMRNSCAACDKPILDKFLMSVLEREWHADCVRCYECSAVLADKCYTRDGKLFCRNDFFRRYGTKCRGCCQGISPNDLVRRARDQVYHLNCFTCMVCRKQLSTGEELYVLDDNKFICKDDYVTGKSAAPGECLDPGILKSSFNKRDASLANDSLLCSASEDEEDDESSNAATTPVKHHIMHHGPQETNNNSLHGPADTKPSGGHHDDSEDQGSLDGDPETRDSQTENKSPDDGNSGSKRRGPRTTIKAKQLDILKTAFSQTPKPTRHIREQLAKETGLPMRVIQVWFQNKRSKERRLKQLTSMGRGPFYGGSRKMRGFPMNLSPGGLDDAPPGFPYFATADGKFEFGYGGPPPFHHDFFPPHHPHHGPPQQGLPFPPGPMDPGPMPMGGDFSGMAGEPPPGFLPQPPPPNDPQLLSQRASPEFITSQGGGTFSEQPPMQNEGLVW